MSDFVTAYTVQVCQNVPCDRKVILSKNYYGKINRFKCPVCLRRSISSSEILSIGCYTQCNICDVYFVIEKCYPKEYIENKLSICYICNTLENKKKDDKGGDDTPWNSFIALYEKINSLK